MQRTLPHNFGERTSHSAKCLLDICQNVVHIRNHSRFTSEKKLELATQHEPGETIVCWYLQGSRTIPGFLGGAGFCPSTVVRSVFHIGSHLLPSCQNPPARTRICPRWLKPLARTHSPLAEFARSPCRLPEVQSLSTFSGVFCCSSGSTL